MEQAGKPLDAGRQAGRYRHGDGGRNRDMDRWRDEEGMMEKEK